MLLSVTGFVCKNVLRAVRILCGRFRLQRALKLLNVALVDFFFNSSVSRYEFRIFILTSYSTHRNHVQMR